MLLRRKMKIDNSDLLIALKITC